MGMIATLRREYLRANFKIERETEDKHTGNYIQYYGRWNMNDSLHPKYSCPGVYIYAEFTGTRIPGMDTKKMLSRLLMKKQHRVTGIYITHSLIIFRCGYVANEHLTVETHEKMAQQIINDMECFDLFED